MYTVYLDDPADSALLQPGDNEHLLLAPYSKLVVVVICPDKYDHAV